MYTSSFAVFQATDKLSNVIWDALCNIPGTTFNGVHTAGTVFSKPVRGKDQYILLVRGDVSSVFGYSGTDKFVSQIRDAIHPIISDLSSSDFFVEMIFVSYNKEFVPRLYYFSGSNPPIITDLDIYVRPIERNWMIHLDRSELFGRKILRNIYPTNVFSSDYLHKMIGSKTIMGLLSHGNLSIFELSANLYGFHVRPSERLFVFNCFLEQGLIVEEHPIDASYFIPDAGAPQRTAFDVYELFAAGTRLSFS
jgi:hypothetical protein